MKHEEPFRPEHALLLKEAGWQEQSFGMCLDPIKYLPIWSKQGTFYSAFEDNELIVIGGIVIFWQGVGEAVCFETPLASEYPLYATKVVKEYMGKIIKDHHLWRVQAMVLASSPKLQRWIELLGFKKEGRMRKYGIDKQDFFRYVIIKE